MAKKKGWMKWVILAAVVVLVGIMVLMNSRTPLIDGSLYPYMDSEIDKPGAAHTITDYSDFECPFCGVIAPILRDVEADFDVQVEYKHFPLNSIHKYAQRAAEASECARDQGRFWAYHDVLFDHPKQLAQKDLLAYGEALGLEMDTFETCVKQREKQATVASHKLEGERLGIRGTPTLYLDGEIVNFRSYDEFAAVLNEETK